ncbi:MAG: MBL fold metallo-hydrolase [Rickettsia endosymbiont of Ixodes persulcatus]|nr:MBL fold metallo-hydrolase [Rickettsia endosymbiont of Ixodes persulcatus]MCZ6903558.1 MBL fold metallo-hydrolase [Rickettsia endosymbiont of Ixodes persulcatus]MCZ6908565.1 MBL fold metallo-hydrolase [Rickettsia endosymbiont of Ixodes persulcatus]MCZ6910407.1 MBL fold metallo-hydrolase [Rickettsia endosymbiont of Ixodes persulcatus]MCZ6913853.1 MBL fold metallo-hydrolase [Rickettsia endosymbiont of Ixodes persulcatus]
MLQVTILGCGASIGVPVIGCDCSTCTSPSKYNKRTRSAIYINDKNSQILVDFGYDIKYQLVREKISKLDCAILTHDHSDHVNGIEDLRVFSFTSRKPLEIYTDYNTVAKLHKKFDYLFKPVSVMPWQVLATKPIDFFNKIKINTIEIQFFRQHHGSIDSLGLRIGDLVYSPDVINFPLESEKFLKDVKIWILDCMDYKSNPNHAGLDKVLEWREKYKPEEILLTNMRHTIDYHEITKMLPSNVKPLYDGYKFTV